MTTIQIITNNLCNNELHNLHTVLHMYHTSYPSDFTYNSDYIMISDAFPRDMMIFVYNDLNHFTTNSYDNFTYKTID